MPGSSTTPQSIYDRVRAYRPRTRSGTAPPSGCCWSVTASVPGLRGRAPQRRAKSTSCCILPRLPTPRCSRPTRCSRSALRWPAMAPSLPWVRRRKFASGFSRRGGQDIQTNHAVVVRVRVRVRGSPKHECLQRNRGLGMGGGGAFSSRRMGGRGRTAYVHGRRSRWRLLRSTAGWMPQLWCRPLHMHGCDGGGRCSLSVPTVIAGQVKPIRTTVEQPIARSVPRRTAVNPQLLFARAGRGAACVRDIRLFYRDACGCNLGSARRDVQVIFSGGRGAMVREKSRTT